MSFIKGAIVAILIGLYFCERKLGFPFRIRLDRNKQEVELVFEYKFINTIMEDLGRVFGANSE